MKPFDYKDTILNRLKEYRPVVHTKQEEGYSWLDTDFSCCIEIQNKNGHSLVIELQDEITISFSNWHVHYDYEDTFDYEEVMNKVLDIVHNRECVLVVFLDGKWLGSGSSVVKEKYTKEEALEFLKTFFVGDSYQKIIHENVLVQVCYWDENRNYELPLD